MRVLWISNIVFPEAENLIFGDGTLKSSGGWMLGLAAELQKQKEIQLSVVSISPRVTDYTFISGKGIDYYLLPKKNFTRLWIRLKEDVKPDVIHIHGTEYPWGWSYVKTCGAKRVCISIQGLLSTYYNYYHSGIKKWQILSHPTLYSIIKGGILHNQNQMKKDSKTEIQLLSSVKHILGRTIWDKSHALAINPTATYYKCGEILRPAFYTEPFWSYENCDKHTIFLSQASCPIKGLHMLLEALPLIQKKYPDTKVRIAGTDITKTDSLYSFLRFSSYGSIIRNILVKKGLNHSVEFIGPLDEHEMKKEYLAANVFVLPSSIENSPNSLGEAQLTGTPCVAADVGGVLEMMEGDEHNVYRFEEIEILANRVCEVFSQKGNQHNSKQIAFERHSPSVVISQLLYAYKNVIGSNS